MNRMIFASNLIYLRHQRKMSLTEVAKELGISDRRYGYYESGTCYPKMSMVVKICDFFGDRDIYKLVTTPLN